MYGVGAIKAFVKRGLGASANSNDGFSLDFVPAAVTAEALGAAKVIRGERPPALMIHGVMPRSGTVYTGLLLRQHPGLHAFPNNLWEVPFLRLTGDIIAAQTHFFRAYRQNIDKMGKADFLPLFGASFIAYLYSFVPPGKRMLLKVPDVRYLNYFYATFPHETPLLLFRDGRDVVASTLKTWPRKRFADVCKLWADSARMILAFREHYPEERHGYLTAKYENILAEPESFVASACERYSLDWAAYPRAKIKDLPVRGSSTLKEGNQDVTWDAVQRPKGFNPVGHWKNWTHRQKAVFKRIAGRTLVDAGYCTDLDW